MSTIVIIVTEIVMVVYTIWSAIRRTSEKRQIIYKAKSIGRRLDDIDDIVFCHSPVYHFVKAKINAAVTAMDNDDDDRAGEYFADALLLIGPNENVLELLRSNLPRNVVKKIQRNYRKFFNEWSNNC